MGAARKVFGSSQNFAYPEKSSIRRRGRKTNFQYFLTLKRIVSAGLNKSIINKRVLALTLDQKLCVDHCNSWTFWQRLKDGSFHLRSLERNDGNSSARLDTPPSIHVDAYINMFSLRSTSGVINRIARFFLWLVLIYHPDCAAHFQLSLDTHTFLSHMTIFEGANRWSGGRQLSHDDARFKRKPAYAHVMREINKFSGLFDRRSEADDLKRWWIGIAMCLMNNKRGRLLGKYLCESRCLMSLIYSVGAFTVKLLCKGIGAVGKARANAMETKAAFSIFRSFSCGVLSRSSRRPKLTSLRSFSQ